MKHLAAATLFAVILVGCSREPAAPPPPKGGINITAPGVNITVDPQGKTKVQAPGVKIEAGDKGAKVEAPGVKVNAPADRQ